jgi:molybdopterin/thiamine biosynthesis adenylyltransferase
MQRSEDHATPDVIDDADTMARSALRERLNSVISDNLRSKSVVIVGVGSGGSQTAEALVRSGIERLVLIDPELVDPANLSRAIYTMRDVGVPKVEALRQRLTQINPIVECQLIQESLMDIPSADIDKIISAADLVIAAADDPRAQRIVNHFAYFRKIPAVFPGVYARGHGGEVVFTVPGLTHCYRCSTTTRHEGGVGQRQIDYGVGRLTAEPALGVDILHIVTPSVKLALALLEVTEEGECVPLRDFIMGALVRRYNYLILSTVPDYGFFPQIFKRVPGQYAYQSAWLITSGDASCSVCGDNPVDPTTVVHEGAPDITRLRPVAEE